MKSIWAMSLFILCLMAIAQSCNVTRVVTTRSEYQQKGDTTITIQTKTTESYDASKNLIINNYGKKSNNWRQPSR